MSNPQIRLRPITMADMAFLFDVYASTRADEMAAVPWTDEQKQMFLRQQFGAQHAHYQKYFAGAEFSVIVVDEEPAGRLYVNRTADEFRIIDISLLPEHRGLGIGTTLLADVLRDASERGAPVRIHVLKGSPALELYGRLGFREVEDRDPYLFMERLPE